MIDLVEDGIDISDEDALTAPAKLLSKALSVGPFFVDASALDGRGQASGAEVNRLFEELEQLSLEAIPTVRLEAGSGYRSAVKTTQTAQSRGCAIRLAADDLVEPLEQPLARLLKAVALEPEEVDLVVDWGTVASTEAAKEALTISVSQIGL